MQVAVKIVLEPVFEADMLPCSYGFRPERGAYDGLQVLIDESWRGRRWVVETDIADCFEAIPIEKLMQAIEAGEPHARFDGRGLETEHPGHGHDEEQPTGNRVVPMAS